MVHDPDSWCLTSVHMLAASPLLAGRSASGMDAASGSCESWPVEIRFVGSGDAFGSGGRYQTSIRLQAEGCTVLVDCGATSMTAMKAQHLDPGEVDAVMISHLHGDHFGGLPFLILDGQFTRRNRPLTVLGRPAARSDGDALPRVDLRRTPLRPTCHRARRRRTPAVHRAADGVQREVDHASGAPALAV